MYSQFLHTRARVPVRHVNLVLIYIYLPEGDVYSQQPEVLNASAEYLEWRIYEVLVKFMSLSEGASWL